MPAIYATEQKFICPIATNKSYMAYIPAVVMTAGIAVVSLWENPQMPETMQMSDKLAHGVMYALLAVAWMVPISRQHAAISIQCRARILPYIYVCALVTGYGALMEILQRFCTLTRSGEMADLYADAIGAVTGVAIIGLFDFLKHLYFDKRND